MRDHLLDAVVSGWIFGRGLFSLILLGSLGICSGRSTTRLRQELPACDRLQLGSTDCERSTREAGRIVPIGPLLQRRIALPLGHCGVTASNSLIIHFKLLKTN